MSILPEMEGLINTLFKFLRLDNLVESLSGYVEARVELIKIEIREDVAKVLARALMVMTVLLLALLFLLFFSVGLAHFLNSYFDQPYLGYWIVAGVYGVPCLIFIIFRKRISHSIEHHMMEMIKRKGK